MISQFLVCGHITIVLLTRSSCTVVRPESNVYSHLLCIVQHVPLFTPRLSELITFSSTSRLFAAAAFSQTLFALRAVLERILPDSTEYHLFRRLSSEQRTI